MNENKAKFLAICSVLIFCCTAGTGWVWWRVLTMPRGDTLSLNHPITLSPRVTPVVEKVQDTPQEPAVVASATITTVTSTPSKVVEKKLPKEFFLNVPFTSQAPEKNWDQPWQDACEEAAVLMMDAYYKGYRLSPPFAKAEILTMVAWEEAKGWSNSIEAEKIKLIFETYLGLAPKRTIRIVESPTVEQIKQFIVAKEPVFVVADGKVLPNSHFQNGGPVYHALVVTGYNETEFVTNDPGTQFGEGFVYKYDDLMSAIHDWNDGDVKEGRRVVLVIE